MEQLIDFAILVASLATLAAIALHDRQRRRDRRRDGR